MELKIRGGDYVLLNGGFERAFLIDEILERVLFKLAARRGCFVLIPELGSGLHTLLKMPRAQWQSAAYQLAVEALEDEPVSVRSVLLSEDGDGQLSVSVKLNYEGEDLTAELLINS